MIFDMYSSTYMEIFLFYFASYIYSKTSKAYVWGNLINAKIDIDFIP